MNYPVGPRTRLAYGVILLGFLAASRLPAQEPILTFVAHRYQNVCPLQFSPDGKLIASAGQIGTVKLWDAVTGKEIRSFAGHLGNVNSMAFSPDGKTLVVGGGDPGAIHYESQIAGPPKFTKKVPAEGELKLWDVSSGKELKTVKFDDETVRELAFVKGGNVLVSGRSNGHVDWWEFPTMRRIKNAKNPLGEHALVLFSCDGKFIPVAPERGGMRIFSNESNEKWFCPQAGYIVSAAVTSDARFVAFGTTEIKVWNVATGKEESSLGGSETGIFALAFSPNGKILASGRGVYDLPRVTGGEIKLWNVAAKKELATIIAHKDIVSCLAFSPDGTILASGSADGTVKLWRVADFDK